MLRHVLQLTKAKTPNSVSIDKVLKAAGVVGEAARYKHSAWIKAKVVELKVKEARQGIVENG